MIVRTRRVVGHAVAAAVLVAGLGTSLTAPAAQAAPTAVPTGKKPAACRHLHADPTDHTVVPRCRTRFDAKHWIDLGHSGQLWSQGFEPDFGPVPRAGDYFVYIGDAPMGWFSFSTTGTATITLSFNGVAIPYGMQRIALYDERGRLVYWDWFGIDPRS